MLLEDEGDEDVAEVVTCPGEVADRSEVADETDVCGEVAASVRGDAEVMGAVEELVGRVWRGCPVDVSHGMQILTTVVVGGECVSFGFSVTAHSSDWYAQAGSTRVN